MREFEKFAYWRGRWGRNRLRWRGWWLLLINFDSAEPHEMDFRTSIYRTRWTKSRMGEKGYAYWRRGRRRPSIVGAVRTPVSVDKLYRQDVLYACGARELEQWHLAQKENSLGSVTTVLVTVRAVLLTSLDIGDRLWLRNRGRQSQRQDGKE